jgi:hypothetical protein
MFPPSSDSVRLSLDKMSLRGVFCIETTQYDLTMSSVSKFPLPPLKLFEIDFYMTGRGLRCSSCGQTRDAGFEITSEITVHPKSGTWPYDQEEHLIKADKYVEQLGTLSEESFCACQGTERSKRNFRLLLSQQFRKSPLWSRAIR